LHHVEYLPVSINPISVLLIAETYRRTVMAEFIIADGIVGKRGYLDDSFATLTQFGIYRSSG
jgi:hypothetical protein